MAAAVLHGLVLAGGRSRRMGADKGLLVYHHKPQREWVADLLGAVCAEVYIACRAEQTADIGPPYRALCDRWPERGPMAALLTAFEAQPEVAWLVVACDLPLLSAEAIGELVAGRDPGAEATAFLNPYIADPDPLLTIWEPGIRALLQARFEDGDASLRRALGAARTRLLHPQWAESLLNANTPEEKAALEQRLQKPLGD